LRDQAQSPCQQAFHLTKLHYQMKFQIRAAVPHIETKIRLKKKQGFSYPQQTRKTMKPHRSTQQT